MVLKKAIFVLMFSIFIGATVLIFLGKEKLDTSLKPLLEGFTIGLSVMSLVALMLLFRKNTFKNSLILEIINIIICSLSIITIVVYARDKHIDKYSGENIGFLTLLSTAIFLSVIILLDDVVNLSIGLNKKISLQS